MNPIAEKDEFMVRTIVARREGAPKSSRSGRAARLILALAVLCALAPFESPVSAGGPIAVVVHPNVAVDELSFADLRRVLLGDRQFWAQNQRVTLLVRAPSAPERAVLLSKVYQMTEAQFKQYWIAKIFRAEATAGPKVVTSNAMACNLVKGIPGAIALVNAAEVPEGVKVLRVDGKRPGESGYKLFF
jgi:hypothetical protein